MQLIATKKATGEFFRAMSITEAEQEDTQATMESDAGEELIYQTMPDTEFERWLKAQ